MVQRFHQSWVPMYGILVRWLSSLIHLNCPLKAKDFIEFCYIQAAQAGHGKSLYMFFLLRDLYEIC